VIFCVFQVTSEMRNDEPIVRHHVPFNAAFQRGTVICIQFGAKCSDGYVQPVPRLLNMTHQQDLCIEHRTDGITCFAELATEKVLTSYESIEHYQVSVQNMEVSSYLNITYLLSPIMSEHLDNNDSSCKTKCFNELLCLYFAANMAANISDGSSNQVRYVW